MQNTTYRKKAKLYREKVERRKKTQQRANTLYSQKQCKHFENLCVLALKLKNEQQTFSQPKRPGRPANSQPLLENKSIEKL